MKDSVAWRTRGETGIARLALQENRGWGRGTAERDRRGTVRREAKTKLLGLALHEVGFVIYGGEQVATQDSEERAKRTASGQCPHLEA